MSHAQKMELLAPAGDFAALREALRQGADSVYFGLGTLNMRSASANFEVKDLSKIMHITKEAGKKAYLALNTVLYDHDTLSMQDLIAEAAREGVDAIIVSDHAALSYAAEKGVPIHISTQMNISNVESVAFYARFATTMVLSRELTVSQVAYIVKEVARRNIVGPDGKLVRIEVFGHGALCMAISGKCYLSLHTHNASANRGACRQNCRKRYEVRDEDGKELLIDNEYIMSPKDLCTLPFLDELVAAGVAVLKIEGRGRSADYVSTVTRVYREAIDAIATNTFTSEKIKAWDNALRTVYNRGFWEGYYMGKNLGEWTEGDAGSRATRKRVYVGKAERWYPNLQVAQFKIETKEVKRGDKLLLIGPDIGVEEFVLTDFRTEDKESDVAIKGQRLTMPFAKRVCKEDKLYKLVDA